MLLELIRLHRCEMRFSLRLFTMGLYPSWSGIINLYMFYRHLLFLIHGSAQNSSDEKFVVPLTFDRRWQRVGSVEVGGLYSISSFEIENTIFLFT